MNILYCDELSDFFLCKWRKRLLPKSDTKGKWSERLERKLIHAKASRRRGGHHYFCYFDFLFSITTKVINWEFHVSSNINTIYFHISPSKAHIIMHMLFSWFWILLYYNFLKILLFKILFKCSDFYHTHCIVKMGYERRA